MSINFRRNYPIILLCVAVLSILIFIMGDARVISYTTGTFVTATDVTKKRG